MKMYAAITDGLGAATIVSGAVTLIIVVASGGTKANAQQGTDTIRISPRLGGVTVSGSF